MRSAVFLLSLSAMAFSSPDLIEDECLSCSLEQDLLWPPNHVLVDVGLQVDEHVDPNATHATSIEVFSDEDDVWAASAQFSPDVSMAGDRLRLRRERGGRDDGRVYLIVVSVLDTDVATGLFHWHVCVFTVVIPHDLSDASIASVRAQAQAAEDYWAAHGSAPPAYFSVGGGPLSGSKQ